MIESKDIEKLALLARIDVSQSEKENLKAEIGSILSYVEQIKEVSASQDGNQGTDEHVNSMREDKNPHETGIFKEDLVALAPHNENGYVKVKKIL